MNGLIAGTFKLESSTDDKAMSCASNHVNTNYENTRMTNDVIYGGNHVSAHQDARACDVNFVDASTLQIAMLVLGKQNDVEPLGKAELQVLACLVLAGAENRPATYQDVMRTTYHSQGRAMTTSLIYKVTANLSERGLIEHSGLIRDERTGRSSSSFRLTQSGRFAFRDAAASLTHLENGKGVAA